MRAFGRARGLAAGAIALAAASLPAACGSRTPLPGGDEEPADEMAPDVTSIDTSVAVQRDAARPDGDPATDATRNDATEAGLDATREADAAPDAAPDVGDTAPDAADAEPDVTVDDAAPEAGSSDAGVDAALPPIDGAVRDAGCTPGPSYLVSRTAVLYAMDDAVARALGTLACPGAGTTTVYSMAVRDARTAYVLFNDGALYQFDPGTRACTKTSFAPGQLGLPPNIGLSVRRDPTPQLFAYGTREGESVLARATLPALSLAEVGIIQPDPREFPAELHFNPLGRLFVLGQAGRLLEIDPDSARLVAEDQTAFQGSTSWTMLPGLDRILMFGGPRGDISSYDLRTKQLTRVGRVGDAIVGAGTVPCAPPL